MTDERPTGSGTPDPRPPATVLRSLQVIYAGLVAGVVGFTAVVVFLVATASEAASRDTALAIAATVVGLILILVSRLVNPPLDTTDESTLARSYQTRMIIKVAIAEGAMLFGVTVFLLSQAWWMLAVTVAFIVAGFMPNAPTRASIERTQAEIMARGSGLSLADALGRPPSSLR